MESSYDRLAEILAGRFEVPVDRVAPSARFGELDMDSLAVVELQVVLTDMFGVELWSDGFDPEMTLQQAAALLASHEAGV